MPESKRHLKLRTFLYAILSRELAERASIGSEQFVYWNASDPRRCVAPDAFVKLGVPDTDFKTWMTWERGSPELAVEIVSDADASDEAWSAKLERYHESGVRELVRFDSDAAAGERLRIWDRLEGDLVERYVAGDTSPCVVLGLYWVVAPVEGIEAGLRLARQADGGELLRSATERLAELEAELARRQ